MVFKKPYAFFIKYFRLINLILVVLLGYLGYKLNLIGNIVGEIYNNRLTNYSSLSSNYVGFNMYVLIIIIILILGGIILLLKYKKKPLKDYLFAIIYIFVIVIYLIFISNIFYELEESVIEQTSLKLYSDISLLIIIPLFYFIFKFILIVIGFNLKKFNFSKDIIELKQDDKDSEEVELIFDKNTYKYKRSINRLLRELKYYFLENRFFITIIVGISFVVFFVTFFGFNIFKSNKVSMNKDFVAGSLVYRVNEVYETKYDLNYNVIKDDSKFVIASITVKNNTNEIKTIDFKRMRILYGDNYVYANNYYNKFFYDLGVPYNNEGILSKESKNYIFIFKVPIEYKSRSYKIKFYDRVTLEDDEVVGSYKELKVKTTKIDKDREEKVLNVKDNINFGNKYGNSNITILGYLIKNNYIHYDDDKAVVYKDNDINNNLLIMDYKLEIDEKSMLKDYFSTDKEFYNKFVSIAYTNNGREKMHNNVNVVGQVDGKILLSVPYEIINASKVSVIFNFRDIKIEYKLK